MNTNVEAKDHKLTTPIGGEGYKLTKNIEAKDHKLTSQIG